MIAAQVRAALAAAEQLQPQLNALITITADAARAAPRGPGPLAAIPFAIKDLFATAGVRTTAGSRILADWVPRRTAPVVAHLEAAGAVSIGKTNTHEFAFGTTNDNPHYGATRNPWNRALTTGGSSGGAAAAVAAGIVPFALGTDTAGSVRIPAALCGCVGFKPAWGVLSTRGVVPLAPTLDTVGILSATTHDGASAFCELVDCAHPAHILSLKGIRVGVLEDHAFDRVEPDVAEATEQALKLLEVHGATIRRLRMPLLQHCVETGVTIVRSEALAFHSRWFPERRDDYGTDVARSLDAAQAIPARDYLLARRMRRRIAAAMRAALEAVDVLAGPTVPITAFHNSQAWEPVLAGGEMPRFALTRMTYPYSLGRLPAISVPSGLSARRLPIGLQLGAGPGRGAWLLAVSHAFEMARGPWPRAPIAVEA
jgi:aspartyl-tRNA(Asn)/glutamyl-tRNA(Gln) amidotransferase subunit A